MESTNPSRDLWNQVSHSGVQGESRHIQALEAIAANQKEINASLRAVSSRVDVMLSEIEGLSARVSELRLETERN